MQHKLAARRRLLQSQWQRQLRETNSAFPGAPVARKAEASEAREHHRPGRGFRRCEGIPDRQLITNSSSIAGRSKSPVI